MLFLLIVDNIAINVVPIFFAKKEEKPHRYHDNFLVIIMIVMTQDNKPCGHVRKVDGAESSTTASLGEQLRCFEMGWDVLRWVEMG